jgi:hypothetical protein
MNEILLAVNKEVPNMGPWSFALRFVGQSEVAAFVAQLPAYGDTVRAWVSEMKHRNWLSAAAFATDFKNVDASNLPAVIFYLAPPGLRIETLVDFRAGIIMLVAIEPSTVWRGNQLQPWNTQSDH